MRIRIASASSSFRVYRISTRLPLPARLKLPLVLALLIRSLDVLLLMRLVLLRLLALQHCEDFLHDLLVCQVGDGLASCDGADLDDRGAGLDGVGLRGGAESATDCRRKGGKRRTALFSRAASFFPSIISLIK